MKYKYLALVLVVCSFLTSCYEDDELTPEATKPYYNITDNPNDPVQHYRYEFYKKYNSVIVTDVSIADYRYNFKDINLYRMTPVKQDEELVLKGIEFMEEIFINSYSDEFLKDNLPVNIILADSIFNDGFGHYDYISGSCSKNYLAIGGIREGISELSDGEKAAVKGDVNARFWLEYLKKVRKLFSIPDEFYEVSKDFYGTGVLSLEGFMATKEDIDWYKYGIISWDPGSVVSLPWMEMFMAPYEEMDLTQWFTFIFTSNKEDLNAIIEKYPLMKQKFEIIDAAMREGLGKGIDEILK